MRTELVFLCGVLLEVSALALAGCHHGCGCQVKPSDAAPAAPEPLEPEPDAAPAPAGPAQGSEDAGSPSPSPTGPAASQPGAGGDGCQKDSDCVPATCCHATSCVATTKGPSCGNTMCTDECRKGSIDCGGGCFCQGGRCAVRVMSSFGP